MRRIFLISFLLAFCFACTKSDTSAVKKPVADPKSILAAAADTPGITLLDAGTEPRRTARYSLPENSSEPVRMTLKMTMTMKTDDEEPASVPAPAMSFPITLSSSARSGGWLKLTGQYGAIELESDPKMAPEVVDAIKSQLEGFEKTSVSYEVDPRGMLRNFSYNVPSDLPPQIAQTLEQTKQSFENTYVVLPEQPIGVGAEWTNVLNDVVVGGISQTMKSHLRVVAADEQKLSLQLTVMTSTKEQELANPDLKALETTAKVRPAVNWSKGQMEVELKRLAPTSEVEGQSTIVVDMSGPDGDRSTTETSVDMRFSFKPAALS